MKGILLSLDPSEHTMAARLQPGALQHFARLGDHWKPEVNVVTAMNAKKGSKLLASAQEYPEVPGYENLRAELVDQSIIEAFQDSFIDCADLCVLGASSKSVFEKLILGSFPKKLIFGGHIPLFINP